LTSPIAPHQLRWNQSPSKKLSQILRELGVAVPTNATPFAIVPSGSGSVVWDVPANLAAGDNSVAFSQANSESIQ
jgi:hypothetical protein